MQTKTRFARTCNWFILVSLILASCSGLPSQATPTPIPPTLTSQQQTAPPAVVETDPPLDSVIGHLTPITFYFNQPMNQSSVEPAFSGLPAGSYLWKDEATLVYTPAQPYLPNSKLNVAIGTSVQSATGYGIAEPLALTFTVADFLRATNVLPKADSADADVNAAIVASFNQPVVALGDTSDQPPAFSVEPPVQGKGEWLNTSAYIFYPEFSMAGGTEYTVSLNPQLKTVSGVPLEGSGLNAWKFVTARPRVVTLNPPADQFIGPDAKITLTFNQPMDKASVESNFLLSGTTGPISGKFAWNEDDTEATFTPDSLLSRNLGYLLKVDGDARSRGGVTLGEEFGAVLNTYPNFDIAGATPYQRYVEFQLSAPPTDGDYTNLVTVTPAVDNLQAYAYNYGQGPTLSVYGDFLAATSYNVELSGAIKDQWGQALGKPFVLNFTTPPLPPALGVSSGYGTAMIRPDAPVIYANAVNIQTADIAIEPLTLQDYFTLSSSFDALKAYQPKNAATFSQSFELQPNSVEPVEFNLTAGDDPLATGVYFVDFTSPQIQANAQGNDSVAARARREHPAPASGGATGFVGYNVDFVVSSQVNLTFKRSAKEAFVWAVDLTSQTPVAGAPLVIYDSAGNALGSGTTDKNGLWQGAINPYEGALFAVVAEPGEENFGLAVNNWNSGFNAWDFGYSQIVEPPTTRIYLYTDRPIYRPGHTVYFRGAARQEFNGRYELPPLTEIPLTVMDWAGTQISTINAILSPFGTFSGEIQLPENAVPGYYTIQSSALNFYFSFQVAEYRKPEINLHVAFATDEIKLGESPSATVDAQYFFGAPAGKVDATWTMYAQPAYFSIPGYQTGLLNTRWYSTPTPWTDLGTEEDQQGKTNPQGKLSIPLPAVPESEEAQTVTLEVTVQDESGLPVSARTELLVHPADFYIGLKSDSWIGEAKEALGFDVVTADWAKNPAGDHALVAEFSQVRWERETDELGFPRYTPVYTPVSSSNLTTGPEGRARLSFVPPNAGTFMLDVAGEGARTQILVWVSGPGDAAWLQLDNNTLQLTAAKDSYKPGETGTVFIPNPFTEKSLALVTVERGIVFSSEVITLNGSGEEYSFAVAEEDAPNVYITVTALGQDNTFRHGVVNVPVAADALKLNVEVTPNPTQAGPREEVTFDVLVTDHQGQPVQGEFSLAVVDLATLALADPNALDIFTEYYSAQPLGIETNISLAAFSKPSEPPNLGMGGGGGGGDGEIPLLREDFPDTAYWNPALVTNSEGRGQVTMTLPDSLTTWNIDVRGLTVDTKVGQADTQIVATKPLLIRPATPRFLVSGDHALMAAVVNNNTADDLRVSVALQSEGFVLDDPNKAAQQVDVPANGRARVEWWGTASLAQAAELIFTAKADEHPALEDSTRPVWGTLPILQYTSPQAFVTGGSLRGAATQQEVISLPRTFTPTSGGLTVELSPSLAGSLTSALEAMPKPNDNSAEEIVSFILPNAEVYRALNDAGLNDPKLVERVEGNLNASVSRIFYLQNANGGWNWWGQSDQSEPVISAYVFFGLLRAREAGASINEEALQRAGAFLRDQQAPQRFTSEAKNFDDAAFIQFALANANTFDEAALNNLYDQRERMNPSGVAWLALALNQFNASDTRVRDLLSNLEATAVVSSSSAHWEAKDADFFTRDSTVYTTSTVVYALAQLDPASATLPNAVRYLTAHRNANKLWNTGHDNAWAILALNAAMVGTGEVRADFAFDAKLNGSPLTNGTVAGIQVTPLTVTVPLEFLSPNSPNLLAIHREDGLGRLYYNATLQLNRPVQDVKPLDKGMQIERVYFASACRASTQADASDSPRRPTRSCPPLSTVQLGANQQLLAQLTLTLPHDAYYVMVEDFIPAGAEVLDQNLNTSQQATESTGVQVQFDDENPFADGWGWWLFNPPQIRDESILFTADYLPAGTYVLTYTLTPLQAGEYRVLPAHAWQAFFPEVQGTSAGTVFEIEP
ncbi:MAG: Ig-like domain-containing protein [Anaerolineales bacterium]|nr:Ig-like domain-containing protein [Anaerolineales bacterium]